MNEKIYEYLAEIQIPEDGVGAFVEFPYDAYQEFGQRRVKVHATFDGIPYDGLVCKMGVYNEKGESVYLIIVPKAIRSKIGKNGGEKIAVTIKKRISERKYIY